MTQQRQLCWTRPSQRALGGCMPTPTRHVFGLQRFRPICLPNCERASWNARHSIAFKCGAIQHLTKHCANRHKRIVRHLTKLDERHTSRSPVEVMRSRSPFMCASSLSERLAHAVPSLRSSAPYRLRRPHMRPSCRPESGVDSGGPDPAHCRITDSVLGGVAANSGAPMVAYKVPHGKPRDLRCRARNGWKQLLQHHRDSASS